MCIVSKFSLIDSYCWFHLFSNYLYLVALLNLKVSYAFMFCSPYGGQAENHLYVFHMIWTHVWLSLFHFHDLFFVFICMFTTWLPSFLLSRLYLHAHVLSSFDPSSQRLHIWSRLWWCMSPQKLFFCYHLPTRGRAGVKLGDADTSQTYL
jgi:hypothetical protein